MKQAQNNRSGAWRNPNTPVFRAARQSDIATQIRSTMITKGLDNKDLAQRLGLSESTISRWLKGDKDLTIGQLYQLADAIQEPLILSVGA